ncbi:MAG: YheC/YheD family endospore coat-associated protein, partial [Thermincolia bacterium]
WIFVDSEGAWVARVLPLPNVIYDRCFGPYGRAGSYKLRAMLEEIPDVKLFNAMPKLKKWETYQVLSHNPRLWDYLPKSVLYSELQDLSKALADWGKLYIKPNGLSKGQGVFRVSEGYDGGLVVEYRTRKENITLFLNSAEEFDGLLSSYREKGGGYIIQQQINLARYKGYPFDLRVLCQKSILGEWIIGGIVARVAARGSIITSPRSGGTVAPWSAVMKNIFKENMQGTVSGQLKEIAMEVCRTIENHYGCCGELGLDLAVDSKGKVSIIEVNGKPLKVSLKRLNDPELNKEIYANPIKFAWFLARYRGEKLI